MLKKSFSSGLLAFRKPKCHASTQFKKRNGLSFSGSLKKKIEKNSLETIEKTRNEAEQLQGFDEFTQKLANSEIDTRNQELRRELLLAKNSNSPGKVEMTHEKLPMDSDTFKFPWTFSRSVFPQKESNLEGFVPFQKVLEADQLSRFLLSFLNSLQDQNQEVSLSELVEWNFLRSLTPALEALSGRNFQIKMKVDEGQKEPKMLFDLYNVENFYGVGLHINRRKNMSAKHYHVYDMVLAEKIPCKAYVKKQKSRDETFHLISRYELNVFANFQLEVVDTEGQVMASDRATQVFREELQRELYVHNLVFETSIFQSDFRSLKKVSSQNDFSIDRLEQVKGGKLLYPLRDYKLVDFDLFLGGNPLCRV